jgi:hypothetical protein
MDLPWWKTPRRIIQPILTIEDGAIDAEKMVRELRDAGCNTILQNVGGMVAWYPTKIAYHEQPDGMNGDVLDAVIRTASTYGMRVLGRFDFSGLREDAFQAHPAWFFTGGDGRPMIDKNFYATCMSGLYINEYVIPVIREVIEHYRLDGAFFNMFGYRTIDRRGIFHGPCYCDACQRAYRAYSGGDLPATLPHGHSETLKYQKFSSDRYMETLKVLNSLFKENNPEFAMLIGLGMRSPAFLKQGLGETTEVEIHWITPNPKKIAVDRQAGWRYITGDTCRQVRTMGGYASMINLYTCGGGRLIAHSRGFVSMGIAQTMANGGWPFIAFTGKAWCWDKKHEQAVKSLFLFMKDNEDCFQGLKSAARIVLINSYRDLIVSGGDQDFLWEFRGFYSTLVRAHQEFDVVDIAQLEDGDPDALLAKYRLAILPNSKYIPLSAVKALERFVSHGGRLIATGEIGKYGEGKDVLWGLKELLGIEKVAAVRSYVENAFFRDDGNFLPNTELVSVNGRVVYAEYKEKTEKLLPMMGEIEYASPELECLTSKNGQYGLVYHFYGKGKSAYIPWELGKLVHVYGQEDHIALMEGIIDNFMEEDRPFITNAPPQVEITLHRQENGRQILQLVNESGQDGMEMRTPITIRDIFVGIKASPSAKVIAKFGGISLLSDTVQNGYLMITLPILELYEMITIE